MIADCWLISDVALQPPGRTLAETNPKPVRWLDTWNANGNRPHWVPSPWFAFWFEVESDCDDALAILSAQGIPGYKVSISSLPA